MITLNAKPIIAEMSLRDFIQAIGQKNLVITVSPMAKDGLQEDSEAINFTYLSTDEKAVLGLPDEDCQVMRIVTRTTIYTLYLHQICRINYEKQMVKVITEIGTELALEFYVKQNIFDLLAK